MRHNWLSQHATETCLATAFELYVLANTNALPTGHFSEKRGVNSTVLSQIGLPSLLDTWMTRCKHSTRVPWIRNRQQSLHPASGD